MNDIKEEDKHIENEKLAQEDPSMDENKFEKTDDGYNHSEVPENPKEGFIERLKKKKGIWGTLAVVISIIIKFNSVIILALTKFKFLLVILKLSKFASTFISMFLMIVVYAKLYGWTFGLGFVGLLFAHEIGHYLGAKYINLNVSMPIFIPFVGAFITMKEQPRNASCEALVAVGGPILGSLTALLCFILYFATGKNFLLALAYVGFMLNLFNLIPVHPLDGGRIVSAISPKMWLIGIPLAIAATIKYFNPIMLIILFLGITQAYRQWKSPDKTYYTVKFSERVLFASVYFGLLILLGYGMVYINSLHININI